MQPGPDEAPSTAAAAVAAWGLPTRHALPSEPRAAEELDALLAECTRHRTLGLLGAAVAAGDLAVTAEQRTRVERAWTEWLSHALRVERLLLAAATALDAAGIPSRVLKGVALAHTAYPDPAMRVFGDVDLLVGATDLTRAADVLAAHLDGERALPELRPGFDDRFGKEVLLRVGALELDVHRTFVEGPFGQTIRLPDLFDGSEPFSLGGRAMLALAPVPRFLHACYAAALGDWPPRLIAMRDVAQLVTTTSLDPDAVRATARRWRAEAVVATALLHAWDTLAITERPALLGWARAFAPTRLDRLLLAASTGSGRGYSRHLAALLVVPGVRPRLAYARAIALPQRAYLEERGAGRTRFASRALGLLRHRGRTKRRPRSA